MSTATTTEATVAEATVAEATVAKQTRDRGAYDVIPLARRVASTMKTKDGKERHTYVPFASAAEPSGWAWKPAVKVYKDGRREEQDDPFTCQHELPTEDMYTDPLDYWLWIRDVALPGQRQFVDSKIATLEATPKEERVKTAKEKSTKQSQAEKALAGVATAYGADKSAQILAILAEIGSGKLSEAEKQVKHAQLTALFVGT